MFQSRDHTGLFWSAQASAAPLHWIFTMQHGDVPILADHAKDEQQKTAQSIVASSRNMKHITKASSSSPSALPPGPGNAGWMQIVKLRGSATSATLSEKQGVYAVAGCRPYNVHVTPGTSQIRLRQRFGKYLFSRQSSERVVISHSHADSRIILLQCKGRTPTFQGRNLIHGLP